MNYFLFFQCEITLYSLRPHQLFLNFLMWDNYTTLHASCFFYSLHSYELLFNFSKLDNYITLHALFFYSLYIHVLFQKTFSYEILKL
jgi:hypothetical protein